jgi:hypothetical protein
LQLTYRPPRFLDVVKVESKRSEYTFQKKLIIANIRIEGLNESADLGEVPEKIDASNHGIQEDIVHF